MKHNAQIHVYLTDEERSLLSKEAASSGVKLSEWVRRAIRSRLGLRVAGDAPLTS